MPLSIGSPDPTPPVPISKFDKILLQYLATYVTLTFTHFQNNRKSAMANGIDKTTLAPDRTHVKSAFVSALCIRLGVNDSPDT